MTIPVFLVIVGAVCAVSYATRRGLLFGPVSAAGRSRDDYRRAVNELLSGLPQPSARAFRFALIAAAFVAVLVMVAEPMSIPVLFLIAVPVGLIWFLRIWTREFLFLMCLGDDDFPGRHDKALWVLVMVVVPPVGLWVFQSYQQLRWPDDSAVSTAKPAPFHDLV